MNSFLPQGYEVPKAPSNYLKFEDGQNRFRALSNPVFGFVYWNSEGKPIRSATPFETTPADIRVENGKQDRIKHFWALVVWNYSDARVQILEITQSSIQEQISDLVANKDWGDPKEYDITITKKGQKLDTEYTVQPSPQKPVPVEAHKAYREIKIDLEALFRGADPFAGGAVVDTPEPIVSPF
jgi:hypothetical protein